MKHQKNRNEVNLGDETIKVLEWMAKKRDWKLKFYMEKILTQYADRYRQQVLSNIQQQHEKNQVH